MKYKMNIWKCLWGSYKDTKIAFADNTIETKFVKKCAECAMLKLELEALKNGNDY